MSDIRDPRGDVMDEICFRYSKPDLVDLVAEDLLKLAPDADAPFRDATRSHVLHVPESLWLRPMVPELTIGLGGSLVDCAPITPPNAPDFQPFGPENVGAD